MSTSIDYIEFICEQIDNRWNVRYKKMFGEYMVYVNEKPIFLVCDNTVYIKTLKEINCLMKDAERGIPYKGSKEHFILDIENKPLVDEVVEVLERITPIPKKKK